MGDNIGIVFIHGAGLSSSIWNDVVKEITVPVLAIDFPNRKKGSKSIAKLTFDDYVSTTINEINNWKVDRFIIVAHSIGACVGLKVADHYKSKLKGFVAIASVIPENGSSFISSLPMPQKIIMPVIIYFFGTKPPQKSIEKELCNDLHTEQTLQIVNNFTPESRDLYHTQIFFNLPQTSRLYIKLKNDKSMPATLQDKMEKNLKSTSVITMDSGHLPMISKAKELSEILANFINQVELAEKN